MKKTVAWTLLVIYLNAAAQSLLPSVADGLAHAFFWQDHLEHVHHGQVHSHHVGLELAAQTGDAHLPVGHPPVFNEDVLSAHFIPALAVALSATDSDTMPLNAGWAFDYRSICLDISYPPPDRTL